jgi:alpha-1,4-digalacturonate transport system substrate-binding protein
MYFSGSWQVGGFANTIGDAFDWVVVPNPTGPGGSTGVVGGAGIAAFDSGDDARNDAITAVMEYLLQPEVYAEFSGRTLNIPAEAAALDLGIDYATDNPLVEAALTQFGLEVGKLQDQAWMVAFNPFSFAYFSASNTRLAQYFFGDIGLDDVTVRIQADIDDAMANAENN